jgi:hypothetical protein
MAQNRRLPAAWAALAWAALAFVCVQAALDIVVAQHPDIDDPEFYRRLELLQARRAEAPGRPLMLFLGSSRTETGFLPEKLPPLRTAAGDQPLVFNCSHLGAGPGMNLLMLRRLLRAGVRPDWLVIEIMPARLADSKQNVLLECAGVTDLSVTRHYRDPLKVYAYFTRAQLLPCHKRRHFLMEEILPGWLPQEDAWRRHIPLNPLGGDEAWMAVTHLDAADVRHRTEGTRREYLPILEDLQIVEPADRAMRETLDLCRRKSIAPALLLAPEGSEFRSWYSAESRRRLDAYCETLRREYQAPLIDARDWLPDEVFTDSHHLNLQGAELFTRRLARDVLPGLVRGHP